jgi:phage repressor protein C with HTH and peptisase S24 domain
MHDCSIHLWLTTSLIMHMSLRIPRPEVGQRLAAAMKASADCQTQTALAKKARVSQSTVGRLLKGLVNSQEPDYQEGDIIYVDPGLAATNGKDIVIRLDDRNEVTFKRLVIEGRRSYLKPLNRAWPDQIIGVPDGARIVGVVIGTWTDR